ncbi:unnamed protein product, partial [Adineta steineri]
SSEFEVSDSENEDEILSTKTINNNNKPNLTKKVDELSSGLPTTTNNSATAMSSALLDNRLQQTCV